MRGLYAKIANEWSNQSRALDVDEANGIASAEDDADRSPENHPETRSSNSYTGLQLQRGFTLKCS